MTLPGDLTTTQVTGTYLDSAGVPQTGRITFTPSAVLTDPTGSVVIPMVSRVYQISAQGTFETDPLVATDAATISPQGWQYRVRLSITGLDPQAWTILLPASGVAVDISGITPVVPQATTTSYLQQAGGTMAGTLTLDGVPPLRIPAGAGAGFTLQSDGAGNAAWVDRSGGDANFIQSFTAASTVTVTHNLGKYPSVTVFDSSGDVCIGNVDFTGLNALTVSFSAPFTGTVTCN